MFLSLHDVVTMMLDWLGLPFQRQIEVVA